MASRLRVFLDTSALIAGIVSSKGAAREVIRMGEAEVIEIVISRQVLVEAERTLLKKFPDLLGSYHTFLENLDPTIVPDPDREQIQAAVQWIDKEDAPILAGALAARVDYLVTWNTRHFMQKSVLEQAPFPIRIPADFLDDFRKWLNE